MAVDASIVNGDITNSAYKTAEQRKTEENTAKNDLDKQAFLKLLVAQMKYQDPMQPTDNTEYVSQLAQFSSLEAMNNMSQSVDLQRATGLIGKVVTATKTDEVTGVVTEKTGSVQFVSQSGSKTYLTIDGDQYELDEISKIWDDTYAASYNLSNAWSKSLSSLPNASMITASNKDAFETQVSSLYASYMSMDEYSKSFISDEDKAKLGELVAQFKMLGVDIDGSAAQAATVQEALKEIADPEAELEEALEDLEEIGEVLETAGETADEDEVTEEILSALTEDTADEDEITEEILNALTTDTEEEDS